MQTLDNIRKEIDQVDRDIISSIQERFKLTQQVSQIKAQDNLPIVDKDREAAQFDKIRQLADEHKLDADMLCFIFRCMINEVYKDHEKAKQR